MADTIGTLVARITATSEGLSVELENAKGKVQKFVKDTEAIAPQGGLLGKIMEGAGIGAGFSFATAAIDGVKKVIGGLFDQFARGDELGDFAAKVGMSVESLTSMQYAAEQLGTSQEALGTGFTKLQTEIGKARSGSEEAKSVFEQLGLSVDQLAGHDTATNFKQVADSIAGIQDPTEQAAMAVAVFGKSGAELLNVLREGSAGIEDMQKKAQELGIVMSTEEAAALEKANKEMQAMWMVTKNAAAHLAAVFAPAVRVVADALSRVAKFVGDVVSGLGALFGMAPEAEEKVAKPIVDAAASFDKMKEAEKQAAEQAKALQAEHDKLMQHGNQVTQSLRNPMEIYADTLADLNNLVTQGAINWETYNRGVEKAGEALAKSLEVKKEMEKFEKTPAVGAAIQGTTGGFSAVQSAIRAMDDAERQKTELARQQVEEQRKANEKLEAIKQAQLQKGVFVLRGNI